MTGALDDFTSRTFTHGGKARTVHELGEGPAVVVITEIPGTTPKVAGFARRVAERGCTVVLPSIFGHDGREESVPYAARQIGWACVSRESATFATGQASPITAWLRALAAEAHERCGGPGVGVVGMCLTGGFALAMMVDETVLAPVLSQPSLPFAVTGRHRRDLGISDADLARVKERVDDGVCVLGLRFSHDRAVPGERFARLREELGDGFIGVEIDSSPGNPHGNKRLAHSVLTNDLVDEPGHPTRDALDQVLDHLHTRLHP